MEEARPEVAEEDDRSTSGRAKKLQKMWKKAAHKFLPVGGSGDPPAPPAQPPEANSAISLSAGADEEIQLTLAEETHPED